MKYIVVGIDDTAHTRHLLDWTARFAADLAAHVTLVHAVPRAELWAIAGAMLDSGKHLDELRRRFERDLVAPLRDRGVAVDLRVDIGDPADDLVETAKQLKAELIIVGSGPHGVVHEIVGGHLSHHLEQLSDVPILVVPRAKSDEPVRA
jgi:nucleotide-binding universal stress UspA family protein